MSSIIPLEGRTRLPSKIQDAIQDSGLIITQILNASRSNELLGTAIKNFSHLDGTIDQSNMNVKKLEAIQLSMASQGMTIENRWCDTFVPVDFEKGRDYQLEFFFGGCRVEVISDVQEQLQTIERNQFYSACPPARNADDSFEE